MRDSCDYLGMIEFSSLLCKTFLFFDIGAGGLHVMAVVAVTFVVKEGGEEWEPNSLAKFSQAGIYMIAK